MNLQISPVSQDLKQTTRIFAPAQVWRQYLYGFTPKNPRTAADEFEVISRQVHQAVESCFKEQFFLRVKGNDKHWLKTHVENPYRSLTSTPHRYHNPIQRWVQGELTQEQAAHGVLAETMEKIFSYRSYKGPEECIDILTKGFSHFREDPKMQEAVKQLAVPLTSNPLAGDDFEVFSCVVPKSGEVMQQALGKEDKVKIGQGDREFYASILPRAPHLPRIERLGEYEVLILPPRLFHQLLKNRWPDTVIKPNPVLGYRPVEKLSDCTQRVMSLSTRFSPALSAHGSEFKWHHTIYWHDMAHLLQDSANPHKEIFAHIAKNIVGILEKRLPSDSQEVLGFVRNRCLDRDFSLYVKDPDRSPSDVFWFCISRLIWKSLRENGHTWDKWAGFDGVGIHVINETEKYVKTLTWTNPLQAIAPDGAERAREILRFYEPKRNGPQKITHPSGHVYEGTFKDGRFIEGTVSCPNGVKKTGVFREDLGNAGEGEVSLKKGTVWFADGSRREGEWAERDGSYLGGKFISRDGVVKEERI